MTISPSLSRKLQESLGQDAGEDLVAWMEHTDTVETEVAGLRRDMHVMRASLESRMDTGFARLEALIERRTSDLMKWSFVFWCGAVAAIAALAGVLK